MNFVSALSNISYHKIQGIPIDLYDDFNEMSKMQVPNSIDHFWHRHDIY